MVDLSVDLGFMQLKNPLIPASGTFGYGEEFSAFFDLDILGAMVLKGIFSNPREGNPPPRIHETAAGLLNSIGLAGPGAPRLREMVQSLATVTSTPIIVNVCGEDDEEYLAVSRIFDDMPEVAALELNISCPNVKLQGRCTAQDARHTRQLVRRIREKTRKPLITKLSPNVADIGEIARAAQEGGSDAISLVNTFLGLAVDLPSRKPVFRNVVAGLSGPAIKPLALRLVYEAAGSVSIPVIGIGGIATGRDVLEYLLVGARAVQTGTVNLVDPGASARILGEMREEMERLGISRLDEIQGRMKP